MSSVITVHRILRRQVSPKEVSNSQVIGCEDRLRNDLYCVGWGVKLCSFYRPGALPVAQTTASEH